MRKINIVIFFVALGACMALGGCSSKDSLFNVFSTGGMQPQTLILRSGLPLTLDPALATDGDSAQIIPYIYEGLVRLTPGEWQPQPCLAQSWLVSEDGKVWTFYLKKGVLFHDGTPLTAAAVKQNYDRVTALGANGSPYAPFVFNAVKAVTARDDHTLVIELEHPFSPLLASLAMPFAAPVASPAALDKFGENFWRQPSGTGPYILKSIKGDTLTLEANANYHNGPPAPGRLVVKAVADARERAKMLLSGKADIIYDPAPEDWQSLRDSGITLAQYPGRDVSYIGFYTNKKPFNSIRLRKAVSLALDKENIVTKTLEGSGVPAVSLVPPGMPGYLKNTPKLYDPALAKKTLAQAGHPGGFKMKLITYRESRPYCWNGGEMLAAGIAYMLADINIEVTVESRGWEDHKAAIKAQEGDAFLFGWTSDSADPDNIYSPILSSFGPNATGYDNGLLDLMLLTARESNDKGNREKLYAAAQEIVSSDVPVIPINHSLITVAHRPGVQLP